MSNKILFVVVDPVGSKIDGGTHDSITKNLGKEDTSVFVNTTDLGQGELYYRLEDAVNTFVNDVNNFDFVCLIPNGSTIPATYKQIFEEYFQDKGHVYFPLALYQHEGKNVILNKHVWNSSIADEAGYLDLEVAIKQIDSTIFGSLIPVNEFFNPENYNVDLEYYQQFHLLNNLAEKTVVMGIPKLMVSLANFDLIHNDVDMEIRRKNFMLSKEKWTNVKKQNTIAMPV